MFRRRHVSPLQIVSARLFCQRTDHAMVHTSSVTSVWANSFRCDTVEYRRPVKTDSIFWFSGIVEPATRQASGLHFAVDGSQWEYAALRAYFDDLLDGIQRIDFRGDLHLDSVARCNGVHNASHAIGGRRDNIRSNTQLRDLGAICCHTFVRSTDQMQILLQQWSNEKCPASVHIIKNAHVDAPSFQPFKERAAKSDQNGEPRFWIIFLESANHTCGDRGAQ